MTVQINEFTQSLTEMINTMEELNNHLEEYFAALAENIQRLNQILRPPEVTQAFRYLAEGQNDEIEEIRNELVEL